MRGDSLLIGVLCLEVLHYLRGFLVPEPFVVVHKDVTVVFAAAGDTFGNRRLRR